MFTDSESRYSAVCAAGALAALLSARTRAADFENEPVIITATRITEDVAKVPASVTVIGGQELRDRGAQNLHDALALAAGVDIAPGGDPGPAASVPEFWGLKEFDAFLLVVDGVPWGGAFNPALATIDLNDVERIEVLRGAAPVMYGATSFVGVIHVIHKSPAKAERSVRAYAGNYGSRGGGATVPLETFGALHSVVNVDSERQGFSDPRTRYEKDQAAWRGEAQTSFGTLKLSARADLLRQNPASPRLRQGTAFSALVPVDSNQNPADAYLNEERYTASAALEHPLAEGDWSTILSYSHSAQGTLPGFLTDITANPDAHGFRERSNVTDVYFDSHVQWLPAGAWKLVAGLDHLHGRGGARGGDFDYFVAPNGSAPPSGGELPSQADVSITDQRDFSGLYGFAEWEPWPAWTLEAGARLNHTEEVRRTSNLDLGAMTLDTGAGERHDWRASGAGGVTWKAWESGRDLLNLFAAYRDSFKPSAVDFGLDTGAQILAPETAQSYEAGAKSRWFDDHLDVNVSGFQMDFRNLVVSTTIGGNPALANSGSSRFRGLELEAAWHVRPELALRAAYSLHDARLRDSVQNIGGVRTDVSGKRLDLSARNMAAAGWRRGGWEARLDGRNLNNQRPPVSSSELGDSQHYLLPARQVELSTGWRF